MSLFFDRIPASDIGRTWRYKGWFLGLVPVWIDNPAAEAPMIVERNGVPTWWFDAVSLLHDLFAFVAYATADVEVPFFFKVTGKLPPPQ
jgi:hypothetical protein